MSNRLLVTSHDSHITEERRIEEKMISTEDAMFRTYLEMDAAVAGRDWHALLMNTRTIQQNVSDLWVMERRLQDVRHINKQFERIQSHIDRIEATEETG